MDLPNLKTINFNNTEIEEIQSNIFDSKVTKLIMNHVKIHKFTTEIFGNLNPNARIEIMNSQLRGWTEQDTTLGPLKLRELTFDNVTVTTSLSKQFINIQANRVFIKNCSLNYFKAGKIKHYINFVSCNQGRRNRGPKDFGNMYQNQILFLVLKVFYSSVPIRFSNLPSARIVHDFV